MPRMAAEEAGARTFIRFVSSTDATRATGLLTLTLVGLIPTEHVCLVWTHCLLKSPFLLRQLMLRPTMDTLLSDDIRAPLASPDPTRIGTFARRAPSRGACVTAPTTGAAANAASAVAAREGGPLARLAEGARDRR